MPTQKPAGKLLLDYVPCSYAHVRATVGLNTQPKVAIATTAQRGNIIYGARAAAVGERLVF